jgi:hypothetical protein
VTIPQISTWARGPMAATTHDRVPIEYVFVRIVTELETCRIYEVVLLII